LNCFSNVDSTGTPPYPCICGPGPTLPPSGPPAGEPRPDTGVTLRAPALARPGEVIEVDVYFDDALKALRGYQLHVEVGGGDRGMLELLDIAVDDQHPSYVFAGAPAWSAFNRSISQLVVGLDQVEGLATSAQGYAATFTYRVPKDATGTFVIELRYDNQSLAPVDRTFLFGAYAGPIDVSSITPALITVADEARARTVKNTGR
jgi:hypothetical protein